MGCWGLMPKSTNMTSMTSEQFGILATLLLIKLLHVQFETVGTLRKKIHLYTDNAEVVQRAQERPYQRNISHTLVAEYDLWMLMWDIITTIPQDVKIL